MTDVNVLKVCARGRSVSAGRSHFLSTYPSFYVLLDPCQGIVGHLGLDFDFGSYLSLMLLLVSNVLLCSVLLDPITLRFGRFFTSMRERHPRFIRSRSEEPGRAAALETYRAMTKQLFGEPVLRCSCWQPNSTLHLNRRISFRAG